MQSRDVGTVHSPIVSILAFPALGRHEQFSLRAPLHATCWVLSAESMHAPGHGLLCWTPPHLCSWGTQMAIILSFHPAPPMAVSGIGLPLEGTQMPAEHANLSPPRAETRRCGCPQAWPPACHPHGNGNPTAPAAALGPSTLTVGFCQLLRLPEVLSVAVSVCSVQ